MGPKVTPKKRRENNRDEISVRTSAVDKTSPIPSDWWNYSTKAELCEKLLSNVAYLKQEDDYRYRQAAIYARLYGNMPLAGYLGQNLSRLNTAKELPIDRPTMSVVTSAIDTLVSRLTQSRPRPTFLTDDGDSKQRMRAKKLNQFMDGEFYRTKAHALGALALRDACIWGPGVIKVLEGQDGRVSLERRMPTEFSFDVNDAFYDRPRQLYERKIIDRMVLADKFPRYRSDIMKAQQAYVDQSSEVGRSISDLVMVAEAWHLPSGPDAGDGCHVIVCSEGVIFEEEYTKDFFPISIMKYSPHLVGPWAQGICEQIMGTQVQINKLLITISRAIELVGVPRIFLEEGSKVVKAHFNNQIGSIVTFRGQQPQIEVFPCVPPELYDQLERLVRFAYNQVGISTLSAAAVKPAGLNSGASMREYDDLQSDRFASLSRRYEEFYIDLAYKIHDKARDILIRDGKYDTMFSDKRGVRELSMEPDDLDKDPMIKCFDSSSLPQDPAGRLDAVVERMQAGIYTPDEGRRLLDFPDMGQVEKLNNACEERILKLLDKIVEEGEYEAPDPFLGAGVGGFDLPIKLASQYINEFSNTLIEPERMDMLRTFFTQIQALKAQAQPPMMPQGAPGGMGAPTPTPQAELLQNTQGQAA